MKVINRKAHFDYEITDKFEAGIVLNGPETKSVFAEHARLDDSYVKVLGNEIYVLNMQILPYQFASDQKLDPKRTRKLLLHKKEIISLKTKLATSNLTLIPLSLYTHGKVIKMEIGLGKGKKKWDKRETIKKREIERKIEGFKKR
jgi:SsrA-binding protein